jgi:hypothetical protein
MFLNRLLFLLLLIIIGRGVKSQTLLNAGSAQIMKEVKLKGGGLYKSSIEKSQELKGRYKKIVFHYPLPPEGNACLLKTTFYLTFDNKCFKYYEDYWGEKLADQQLDELKRYYPNLRRVKNALKWIDNDNGFEVNLIPERIGNNKFASAYLLEVKKI